jgi:hypothetical protein
LDAQLGLNAGEHMRVLKNSGVRCDEQWVHGKKTMGKARDEKEVEEK